MSITAAVRAAAAEIISSSVYVPFEVTVYSIILIELMTG